MMRERSHLKHRGATWWVTDETQKGGCPGLTKASLGAFFFTLLSEGAQVGEVWAFSPAFRGSIVLVHVFATAEQKAAIEAKSPFRLRKPPEAHLNSGARPAGEAASPGGSN